MVVARVREALALEPGIERALDVGCGTGQSTETLRDLADRVVGVAPSRAMLAHAPRGDGFHDLIAAIEAGTERPGDACACLVTAAAPLFPAPRRSFAFGGAIQYPRQATMTSASLPPTAGDEPRRRATGTATASIPPSITGGTIRRRVFPPRGRSAAFASRRLAQAPAPR